MPAPRDPAEVDHLIASLESAQELIRDLCAKNEVLVSQLEQLPRRHQAQIDALRESIAVATRRVDDAQQQLREILNSRIWRLLVRAGGIGLRLSGRSPSPRDPGST